jgi:NAD(P)-dependent dehydrogenase (short-subunit alcohol dehydrogenase family)
MGRLEGRVAVVTGGGEGIGRGIARRYAAEGARVVIADVDEDLGAQTAKLITDDFGIETHAVRTDVSTKADVLEMVAQSEHRFGQVDILVNNAWGGGGLHRVEYKSDADLAHGFGVGFYGPLWAMQAVFPGMKERGWGRIINLCSLNGVNAHIGTLEYNVAKEALRTLTRTAAREWAPTGVVVNAICPAARSAALERLAAEQPDLIAMAGGMIPMGRMGDPEDDIAPVAVFLASDDARYLTGNTLFVDGGSHINGSAWAPELPDA